MRAGREGGAVETLWHATTRTAVPPQETVVNQQSPEVEGLRFTPPALSQKNSKRAQVLGARSSPAAFASEVGPGFSPSMKKVRRSRGPQTACWLGWEGATALPKAGVKPDGAERLQRPASHQILSSPKNHVIPPSQSKQKTSTQK